MPKKHLKHGNIEKIKARCTTSMCTCYLCKVSLKLAEPFRRSCALKFMTDERKDKQMKDEEKLLHEAARLSASPLKNQKFSSNRIRLWTFCIRGALNFENRSRNGDKNLYRVLVPTRNLRKKLCIEIMNHKSTTLNKQICFVYS